jgi:hypothetical protein
MEYDAWKAAHPGHVGPSIFFWLGIRSFMTDKLHLGLSLVPKELRPLIDYAMGEEAAGKQGVLRFLCALRCSNLPLVARRIELAIKDAGVFNVLVKKSAQAGVQVPASDAAATASQDLVKNYVKDMDVAALKAEFEDLGLAVKDNGKIKKKATLKFELESKLHDLRRLGKITALQLLSGDRLKFASDGEANMEDVADAALAAGWGVTMPQLNVIICGRLKMIGRETRMLLTTYRDLIKAMNKEVAIVSDVISTTRKSVEKMLSECEIKIQATTEALEDTMDETLIGAIRATLEVLQEELESLVDEHAVLVSDAVTVEAAGLNPDLQKIEDLWDLFVAAVKPWILPPVGDAKTKIAALEGHGLRCDAWMKKRRRLGLSEKAFYLHDFVAHGEQTIAHFKEHLPGYSPTDFNCELQELSNKLIKLELPPLLPMLRNKKLKNALYYVMRDWWVRLLHFPDTIHARRNEKCGSCQMFGHRRTNRICEKWPEYVAKRKSEIIEAAAAAKAAEAEADEAVADAADVDADAAA